MSNHFRPGEIIANDMNPSAALFACGSVRAIGGCGYWVEMLGGGCASIPFDSAVLLKDLLKRYPTAPIVLREKAWRKKIFIGGVIAQNDVKGGKYNVKIPPSGTAFISHQDVLLINNIPEFCESPEI